MNSTIQGKKKKKQLTLKKILKQHTQDHTSSRKSFRIQILVSPVGEPMCFLGSTHAHDVTNNPTMWIPLTNMNPVPTL